MKDKKTIFAKDTKKLRLKNLEIHIRAALTILCILVMQVGMKAGTDVKEVLLVSSYATDSKRVTSIINAIDRGTKKMSGKYNYVLEDMGCGPFSGSTTWKGKMRDILRRHPEAGIKAVVLIGQEAWATYLSMDSVPKVQIFGCFVSRNGIKIADDKSLIGMPHKSVDMIAEAKHRGLLDGIMFDYDVSKNIDMILMLYPSVKHIAFLTDNSYGGVSLRSYVEKVMREKYPQLRLIPLDGQRSTEGELKERVLALPKNSAVILGAWRVDKNETFFFQNSLQRLFSEVHGTPVFTMTGIGLGTVAIGGYYPDYDKCLSELTKMIEADIFSKDKGDYRMAKNRYVFSATMIEKYGMPTYKLPKDSTIVTEDDMRVARYKNYIMKGGILFVILMIALIGTIWLYVKNRRANVMLKEQQQQLSAKQAELIRAKEQAEQADKLKSSFLANMSHEIRTPLNAIVGFSEMLGECTVDEREEYLQIIRENTGMLLNLINDILDISKIEAGTVEMVFNEFDLSKCFNSVYSTLKQMVRNEHVKFIIDNPYETYLLRNDEKRITQVITNFVTNAIKFTKTGAITIGYLKEGEGVYIYCADTGIGIEKEKAEKVFDRFYQSNQFSQGTGLGLAICKAIVDAQGGRIGVETELGKGSTFWVWLPDKKE